MPSSWTWNSKFHNISLIGCLNIKLVFLNFHFSVAFIRNSAHHISRVSFIAMASLLVSFVRQSVHIQKQSNEILQMWSSDGYCQSYCISFSFSRLVDQLTFNQIFALISIVFSIVVDLGPPVTNAHKFCLYLYFDWNHFIFLYVMSISKTLIKMCTCKLSVWVVVCWVVFLFLHFCVYLNEMKIV